jgi:hypothetical protein
MRRDRQDGRERLEESFLPLSPFSPLRVSGLM